MVAMSLEEFLGLKGVSSPISSYMDDKLKVPKGMTARKRKELERSASEEAEAYSLKRQEAIAEYRMLLSKGDLCQPTKLQNLMKIAGGHPDNSATQSARRVLYKRYGVNYLCI